MNETRHYADYTDTAVKAAVEESKSIAETLRKIGLRPTGGNYFTLKKLLKRLQLDTSHWTGQGWNKGEQLKDWSSYTSAVSAKKQLLKVRGHQCEVCRKKRWQASAIPIELHHKDGDRTNNSLENLQLICPNCHAQTGNWKSKKRV